MTDPGKPLEACPHCGAVHPEEVLVCPTLNRLLPLEGRLLDSRFRFVRKLGEGGMSTVWMAENFRVRKRVAIKIMHPEYARNPRTLHRFQNEATSAGRIGNPHICDILDLGESPLGPYIVMEMLVGQSFAELLESQGRIDPQLAVLIVREALKGLAAAHAVGIIHRDLKPENVFLHEPEPGRMLVKLMDFGISKFTEDPGGGRTGANVVMGTPEYMSPEQAAGAANVDARTDIWAMGVMLYRAISGVEPFRGKTMAALLLALSTEEPPPLQGFVPNLAPGLIEVINRCLRKAAEQRYQSCNELYDALAPYQQAVAEGERPAAPIRTGKTMAMNLDLAAAAALAAGKAPGPDTRAPAVTPVRGSMAMSVPATSLPGTGPGTNMPTHGSGSGNISDPALAPTAAFEPPGSDPGLQPGTQPSQPGLVAGAAPRPGTSANTWSTELNPGLAPEQSWSMGQPSFGDSDVRPYTPTSERRGSPFTWVIIIGVLALLGGGGVLAWSMGLFGGGGGGGDGKGGDEESGGDAVVADAQGGDAPADDGAAADTDAAETGAATTGAEEAATTGTETGSAETTTGGAETTTGGAETTTGSAETTTGDEDDDGGDEGTTGGSKPKPKPDFSKVHTVGPLVTSKTMGAAGDYESAKKLCAKYRSQRKHGFSKWRMGNALEVLSFRSSGVSKLRYWTSETSGDNAKVVDMVQGRTATRPQSDTAPRAFCVSAK
ncbi:MAG: protein kinase [Myxococcales bacterium]|nr:protein kinase [Myxococcales bacterium]